MKRFLFAWEGCVLFRRLIDSNSINSYIKIFSQIGIRLRFTLCLINYIYGFRVIFFFLFFIIFSSCGAFKASNSKHNSENISNRYEIGDKLNVDFVLGYDALDSNKIYTISEFKGKALIIDVWATWCGACISKFPTMDSLATKYDDQLKIVLLGVLGRDTPQTIHDFALKYYDDNPNFKPIFLTANISLQEYFAIYYLPHYIWIDPNRRIRAFTDFRSFEDENLKRLIAGLSVPVPVKTK